jgi:membrane fusion protein (multidrug efflux system)
MRELTVAKQAVIAAKDNLAEARAKRGKDGDQNAQIIAAKAAVAQATLDLQYTNVYAPANGQLAEMTLQPGQTVTAYQSLFSLVEDHTWWAMANMKETNLNRVRVGQKAVVQVDMYPSHPFHGIVKSISPGSGSSFALLPAENATGNWVKVTQRFPVRVEIQNPDAHFPLRIGASCTVTIDTQS